MLLSLIFFYCNDKDDLSQLEEIPLGLKEMKDNDLSFDDMGRLHNEYLKVFMKN